VAAESLWASSARLIAGLTEMLLQLREQGLVGCRDRDGKSADPLDLDVGAYWHLTPAGREALQVRDQDRGE
jgi:hypothetical protein